MAEPPHPHPLHRTTLLVSTAALASRLLGLLRDLLLAAVLGAGPAADAFFVAWRLPNLFRRVLGEGALNAGLVPLERRIAAEQGSEAAARFAGQALAWASLVLAPAVAALAAFAPVLVGWMAPGFAADPATFDLAVACLRLTSPAIAAAVLAGLLGALINARGRFPSPAMAGLSTNLVMIGAILLLGASALDERARAIGLALAVTLGGLIQLALLSVPWAQGRLRLIWSAPRWSSEIRGLVIAALPGLFVAALGPLAVLIGVLVASRDPSAVAHLNYADRLFQLPLGFIALGAGVVLLPELTRWLRDDPPKLHAAQNQAIRLALALALPGAAALWLLAEPIVSVLFQRGAFQPADTAATAQALAGLAWGLPGAALARVIALPFFARERPRLPVLAGLAGLIVTGLASSLIQPIWGVAGVAGAISLGLSINAALLLALAHRRGWWRPDRGLARAALGLVAATAGMAVALALLLGLLEPWLAPDSALPLRAGALTLLCANGFTVFALLALLLGAISRTDIRRVN
jgi:putative peptidoglycan lipid II flippase